MIGWNSPWKIQKRFLTVTSTSVAAGATVALSGMGFDFTVAVTGASSQTVAAGQGANFTLIITPLNGSAGSFSFVCPTLPEYAACIFNPVSETVTAGSTGNVTVEVTTGAAVARAAPVEDRRLPRLPVAVGLLLLPVLLRRRRNLVLMAALAAVLASAVCSCTSSGGGAGGGSGGQKGGSNSTPAGTYSLPVTLTSTGISHSTTVTMTVD